MTVPAAYIGPEFSVYGRRVVVPRQQPSLGFAYFVDDNGRPVGFEANQISTAYIDFLGASDMAGCVPPDPNAPGGTNIFLEPAWFESDQSIRSANTWVANDPFGTSGSMSVVQWPPGNWYVMAKNAPDAPVHMSGTMTGLPEAARVTLRVPDADTALFAEFAVGPGEGDCVGAPLEIEVDYKIPNRPPIFSSLTVDLSDTRCSRYLDESRTAHFQATVYAKEDYLHYGAGEPMYDVSVGFFNDVDLPAVDGVEFDFDEEGTLTGAFRSSDPTSTPTQAWLSVEQYRLPPVGALATVDAAGRIDEGQTRFTFEQAGIDPSRSAVVTLGVARLMITPPLQMRTSTGRASLRAIDNSHPIVRMS